jgi:polysaccharide biosynthesis/export protein
MLFSMVTRVLSVRMKRLRLTRATRMLGLFLLFLSPLSAGAVHAMEEIYKVGVGDVLSVTVYGDPGLTGLFPVSTDGAIGYPILGKVDVSGKTAPQIALALQASLDQHIANLSVAVSVKEYAPTFIVGDVRNPGKYEFRPGMIVLEIFALSGGLRTEDQKTNDAVLQLVNARQDYADLQLQLLAQDIKRARLEAELKDAPFSYDIAAAQLDPASKAAAASVINSEVRLHEFEMDALKTERNSLLQQKENYAQEIKILESTLKLRENELTLMKGQVDASSGLVDKGLVAKSELVGRQREVSAANRDLLEAGAYLARARQNENEMDQRILALDQAQKNNDAKELREVSVDLVRLRKRMTFSLQQIATLSSAAQRAGSIELSAKTDYSAVRAKDGKYHEIALSETDPVQSGDIIRVTVTPGTSDLVVGATR